MIIDCDNHFFPPDAFDHVPPAFRDFAPKAVFNGGALVDVTFPGAPPDVPGTTPNSAPGSGAKSPGMTDLRARMRDYDAMGIEQQLIIPQFSGWWSYLIEPNLANAMAHSWNIAMQGVMNDAPGRVHGVALVALQDVEASIREIEWARANGFRATVLDYHYPVWDHPYGTALATHREAWPFFEACEALDMPIYLHAVQHGHRLVNLMNFQVDGLDYFTPSEPQMNLVALITTGLLDAYPGLKIIHAELGAARIKPLATALDDRWNRLQPDYEDADGYNAVTRRRLSGNSRQLVAPEVVAEKNKMQPSHYFKKNFFWTVEPEQSELAEAVQFVGADRFLFATDYPHDDAGGTMRYEDVALLDRYEGLSDNEKEQIRVGTATDLFGLADLVGNRG